MSEYKQDQIREDGHDGGQESDNQLPTWWLWILYGSIVLAVGYWLVFEALEIVPDPNRRADLQMTAAAEAQLERMAEGGPTDESLNLMAGMPDRVSEGQKLYRQYCVVCHDSKGQGKVGPNLTDRFWIHGGKPTDLLNTITNGVPSKGMAAWGRQLGPRRAELVVSYMLTLRNTEVPGKDPEGEPYEGL